MCPRLKNFRGLTLKNVDKKQNLTLCVNDLIAFPGLEEHYDRFSHLKNLTISFVFSSTRPEEIKFLCRSLRVPLV